MLPLSYQSPLAILIVDDEPAVLIVLETMLQADGHFVGATSNGVEALQLFRKKHWDVVLTDRAMPGVSGEAVALAIKQISRRTPVVMVTGTPPRTGSPCVDAIVHKPFTRAHLADGISRALSACALADTSPSDTFSAAA